MAGLLMPGPTLAQAEELRKRKGSRGLLEALGEPMSYAPNPVVAALGQGLLGARYLTGEKSVGEGMASLSDMTAMAIGSRLPPSVRNVVMPGKYAISHRPMDEDGGAARLHDLTPAFGSDIYGPNGLRYFGASSHDKVLGRAEKDFVTLAHQWRGKPDADVTIYRGVPNEADSVINPGDWVAISKDVAAMYGPKVVAMKVKAKDITSWADSLFEFGYYPSK